MNQAAIRLAVRYRINELSTDTGALLDGNTILDELIEDAIEEVVLDLMPTMSWEFLSTEDISLTANTANVTPTAEYWQIYKLERNVTDKNPRQIHKITPLHKQFYMNVGETKEFPRAWYEQAGSLYFVPTPSTSKTDYAKMYYIAPEVVTMVSGGPALIPRPFLRCIVYAACVQAATMLEVSVSTFIALYEKRMAKGKKVYRGKSQQSPRFIQPALADRIFRDDRERAFYDIDWDD